jgi:hypothetical protein
MSNSVKICGHLYALYVCMVNPFKTSTDFLSNIFVIMYEGKINSFHCRKQPLRLPFVPTYGYSVWT